MPLQTQCPTNDEHVSADEADVCDMLVETKVRCNCHSQKTYLVARLDHITSKLKKGTAASQKTQVMPGTSQDKLGFICVELKTVG